MPTRDAAVGECGRRSKPEKSWDAWHECMREEPEMSERAREFLEHWLSGHVGAVADEYRMRETVRLVALCRGDGIRAGIAPDELRTAAGGNLIQSMLTALSAAAGRTKVTADSD